MSHSIADIDFRHPTEADAAPLWRLLGELDGLERNTCYAYVLMCTHFAPGCLVAARDGELVGCVLGYRPPSHPNAMFVWQIGVHPDVRRRGVAGELLARFCELPVYRVCEFLEATVGSSNRASAALFRGFARERGAACEVGRGFPAALFAPSGHEDEPLFRIGPLRSQS